MFKFLYRLLGTLLVGSIISLWIVQNNNQVEKFITQKLLTLLEKEWNATITTKKARINLFTTTLFLYDGKVIDNQHQNCSWTFEQAKVHASPILYLVKKKLYLWITLNNIFASTKTVNQQPNLIAHIKKITASHEPPIPISIQQVRLNNFDITLQHQATSIHLILDGYFELLKNKTIKQKNQRFSASVIAHNFKVLYNNKLLLDHSSGSCSFYQSKQNNSINLSCQADLNNVFFDAKTTYNLQATWTDHKQELLLSTPSNPQTNITCRLQNKDLLISGTLDPQIIINVFNSALQQGSTFINSKDLKGTCNVDFSVKQLYQQPQINGKVTCNNLSYKDLFIKNITWNFEKIINTTLASTFTITPREGTNIDGAFIWNWQQETGSLSFVNQSSIKLSTQEQSTIDCFAWALKKKNFNANIFFNKNGFIDSNYAITLTHHTKQKHIEFKGKFDFNSTKKLITISGKTRKGTYLLEFYLHPSPHLSRWEYAIDNQKIIDLHKENPLSQKLRGTIRFSLLRSFLSQSTKRLMLGNNLYFDLFLDQTNYQHLTGSLALKGGKIYFPESRNLLQQFSTNFILEFFNKKILLDTLVVNFCKGAISSPRITILFDNYGNVSMVHAPLHIEDLFANWKRDFYGVFYGNLLINKLPESAFNFSGTLVLKKSFLRENIFSQDVNSASFSTFYNLIPRNQKIKIDLRFFTEQPIKAKTDALEAYASMDLKINYAQGQDKDLAQLPRITGSIKLENGHLQFLRNKLNIEYGKIQFITNQMNDPLIDLIARNNINKYTITLQATGSLQKPTIILESNPELTEEQIIGLLLTGSENAKLQTDLFAMLEQNLHNIILGSKSKLPKATTFLEKITRPLKYIQITPDFTDQSGRGGIKGTVSVNVTDQVHAQIQQNLNFQEDFSAEVEYLLADDISLKGVKDQRGELGAEVELKVKL